MGEIRPEFGGLFGPTKSVGAAENLFAWDSAQLRPSPVRFVRQVGGPKPWRLNRTKRVISIKKDWKRIFAFEK